MKIPPNSELNCSQKYNFFGISQSRKAPKCKSKSLKFPSSHNGQAACILWITNIETATSIPLNNLEHVEYI